MGVFSFLAAPWFVIPWYVVGVAWSTLGAPAGFTIAAVLCAGTVSLVLHSSRTRGRAWSVRVHATHYPRPRFARMSTRLTSTHTTRRSPWREPGAGRGPRNRTPRLATPRDLRAR